MKKVVCALALSIAIAGCGNADKEKAVQLQGEVDSLKVELAKLKGEAKSLKDELDAERNGPARLLARGKNELSSGDMNTAKRTFSEIASRFPEAEQAGVAKASITEIDAKIAAAEKVKAADAAREAEERRHSLAKIDSSLVRTHDEFKGITWIEHKSQPVLAKYIAIYFALKDNKVGSLPLRMKIGYYASDWLFVDNVSIKADDETFDLPAMEFERDNGGGAIWEWSDTHITDTTMIRKIISSKRAVIRFNGRQYHSDFVVPESQKKTMQEMLLAWERYGGKP